MRALVIDSAYSDSTPTTLMLVTHGSWITATISNLLELDPDGMNALGGMRNACWCRLKVRHSQRHPHRTAPVGVGGIQQGSRHRRQRRLGERADRSARTAHAKLAANRLKISQVKPRLGKFERRVRLIWLGTACMT